MLQCSDPSTEGAIFVELIWHVYFTIYTQTKELLLSGLAASNIVYVFEISHKKYRPALLSLVSFYFAFGILLVSILQIFLIWRQVAFFNGIFFTVVLILIAFSPESPIWLAKFGCDWDKAKKSLQWLNPNKEVKY